MARRGNATYCEPSLTLELQHLVYREHSLVGLLCQGHRGHLSVLSEVGRGAGVPRDRVPSLGGLSIPVPMVPVQRGLKVPRSTLCTVDITLLCETLRLKTKKGLSG